MSDKRKYNGGHSTAGKAGRKSKAEEKQAAKRITNALKTIYMRTDDEDAIHEFLVDYGQSRDGKKFFAEHLLGKAPDKVQFEQEGMENIPIIQWVKNRD